MKVKDVLKGTLTTWAHIATANMETIEILPEHSAINKYGESEVIESFKSPFNYYTMVIKIAEPITPKATLATGEVVTIHYRHANGIAYVTPMGIRFAYHGQYTE